MQCSCIKFSSRGMFKERILGEVSFWPSISIHQTVISGLTHPFFALSHVKSFAFLTMHPLCGAIFFTFTHIQGCPERLWKICPLGTECLFQWRLEIGNIHWPESLLGKWCSFFCSCEQILAQFDGQNLFMYFLFLFFVIFKYSLNFLCYCIDAKIQPWAFRKLHMSAFYFNPTHSSGMYCQTACGLKNEHWIVWFSFVWFSFNAINLHHWLL